MKELACLCGDLLFHLDALAEAVRLSHTFQDVRLVRNPVQKCCRHDLIAKDGIPVRKAQVRGDNDRYPFMEVRAQLKQELCSVFSKGNEAQFIQPHQIKFGDRRGKLGQA